LGIKGSSWKTHVVKTVIKLPKEVVGLNGVDKKELYLHWCQVKHW
jgi:hypothetical protein